MEVSDQIIAVFDNLAQKFGIVIDWTKENIAPYIQQLCEKYISWKIATSIVWMCFGIVCFVAGCIFFKSAHKWHETYKDDYDYKGMGKDLFTTVAIFCWIATLGIVTAQAFDIVKCCVFPELQVFEFVKSMT